MVDEARTVQVLQGILDQLKIQNQLRLGGIELFRQYADKETRAPLRYPILVAQNSSRETKPDKKTADNWFNEMACLLMKESKISSDLNTDVILDDSDDRASAVIEFAKCEAKAKVVKAKEKASAMLKSAKSEAASIEEDAREQADKLKRESDLKINLRWSQKADESTGRWNSSVSHVKEYLQELSNAAEAASIPDSWLDDLKESIQYDISEGKALLSTIPPRPVLAIMLPIHTRQLEYDIMIINKLKRSLDKCSQDKSREAISELTSMINRYAELREKK